MSALRIMARLDLALLVAATALISSLEVFASVDPDRWTFITEAGETTWYFDSRHVAQYRDSDDAFVAPVLRESNITEVVLRARADCNEESITFYDGDEGRWVGPGDAPESIIAHDICEVGHRYSD